MAKPRTPWTQREKYGEEVRLRRTAADLTQEELGNQVVCSPTLISHFEAGRRLPKPDDAHRIDQALGTDGFFVRWLEDLESKYADHFAAVAELEQQATLIQQFALSLVPGVFQTMTTHAPCSARTGRTTRRRNLTKPLPFEQSVPGFSTGR